MNIWNSEEQPTIGIVYTITTQSFGREQYYFLERPEPNCASVYPFLISFREVLMEDETVPRQIQDWLNIMINFCSYVRENDLDESQYTKEFSDLFYFILKNRGYLQYLLFNICFKLWVTSYFIYEQVKELEVFNTTITIKNIEERSINLWDFIDKLYPTKTFNHILKSFQNFSENMENF